MRQCNLAEVKLKVAGMQRNSQGWFGSEKSKGWHNIDRRRDVLLVVNRENYGRRRNV
jgi:hypothetical protein